MEKDFIHLEGTTLLELTHKITKDSVGPKTKDSGKVFYNPAMAGSRTRRVNLMKKNGILTCPIASGKANNHFQNPYNLKRIMVGFDSIKFPYE